MPPPFYNHLGAIMDFKKIALIVIAVIAGLYLVKHLGGAVAE